MRINILHLRHILLHQISYDFEYCYLSFLLFSFYYYYYFTFGIANFCTLFFFTTYYFFQLFFVLFYNLSSIIYRYSVFFLFFAFMHWFAFYLAFFSLLFFSWLFWFAVKSFIFNVFCFFWLADGVMIWFSFCFLGIILYRFTEIVIYFFVFLAFFFFFFCPSLFNTGGVVKRTKLKKKVRARYVLGFWLCPEIQPLHAY